MLTKKGKIQYETRRKKFAQNAATQTLWKKGKSLERKKPRHFFGSRKKEKLKIAPAGNRTRVARVAGEHSTTRPPVLLTIPDSVEVAGRLYYMVIAFSYSIKIDEPSTIEPEASTSDNFRLVLSVSNVATLITTSFGAFAR